MTPIKPKKRTYSLRLIRDDYTYSLEQIADMFGLELVTIRRWIKDEGLERLPKTRPSLVHSSALQSFLSRKQKSRRRACSDDQAYCFRCRCPRKPRLGTGKAHYLPNGSVRFQAECSTCGGGINKAVKGSGWAPNHPLAVYQHDATQHCNREQLTHPECQFQQGEGSCLNTTR
jgi:hypothetical protein